MIEEQYRQRFRVIEGMIEERRPEDNGFDLVVGASNEPRTVEAALAYLVFVPKLVCVDWADVLEVSGSGLALACVIEGVFNVEPELKSAREYISDKGFGSGFILIQLPGSQDFKQYPLKHLEDVTEDVFIDFDGLIVATLSEHWFWSRSVLIGFQPRVEMRP